MDARQFTGGVGVTTVIAVLSSAAIASVLGGFALTTYLGATNRLGFNASTVLDNIYALSEPDTELALQSVELEAAAPRGRAVCLSDTVLPSAANLNLAFSTGGGNVFIEGQLHGALSNVSYPMLVLSSTEGCSAGLERASHLAHYPLPAAGAGVRAARVLEVPLGRFDRAVLDDAPRTVWLHADGKPVDDACCIVRKLA